MSLRNSSSSTVSTQSSSFSRSKTPGRRRFPGDTENHSFVGTQSQRNTSSLSHSLRHSHKRSASVPRARSATRGGLRNSHRSAWNVGLNVEKLEHLLCVTLPQVMSEDDEANVSSLETDQFRNLAEICRQKDDVSRAALTEASEWIRFFLTNLNQPENDRRLAPELTAELHSYIGLIREIRGDTMSAIQSYTKALWLLNRAKAALERSSFTTQSKSDKNVEEHLGRQLAKAMYRLGGAYGRLGEYTKMQELIDRAESLQEQFELSKNLSSTGFY